MCKMSRFPKLKKNPQYNSMHTRVHVKDRKGVTTVETHYNESQETLKILHYIRN